MYFWIIIKLNFIFSSSSTKPLPFQYLSASSSSTLCDIQRTKLNVGCFEVSVRCRILYVFSFSFFTLLLLVIFYNVQSTERVAVKIKVSDADSAYTQYTLFFSLYILILFFNLLYLIILRFFYYFIYLFLVCALKLQVKHNTWSLVLKWALTLQTDSYPPMRWCAILCVFCKLHGLRTVCLMYIFFSLILKGITAAMLSSCVTEQKWSSLVR